MAFKNPRKFDHYTSDVELEQRRALYRTRDYNWFLQARRGEIPGLPPMCRHWAERSFEVFLKDLGVKPDLPLTHRLTFEVAPDATEISPRTCRIAKQTPRRINRSTRRTLGMDQAVKAIESMQFTIATPERMRLQGHFGSQRPQDCKHPVTRKTITGPHTRLEPAKPDPQFTNPLWGKAAFTVDEYRRLIVPRLINFIDHLGHYIKPTGKTRYGMPIHAGWVPLTSEAHGYGKPEELNDAQWDAWRRALAKAFTAPTASPNGCFGGSVNMADFEALFNDNANGKSGKPGKARSKRLPFITTDKAGNPIYELGKFPEDQCWNLTKATDVEPGRIHMTLFGDLGDLTHAMRWNLIANYPSANVAMLERS